MKKPLPKTLLSFAVLLFSVTALMCPAVAQTPPKNETLKEDVEEHFQKSDEQNYLSLSIENDLLGGGTDQYYTSGVRITYFNASTPVPAMIDEMADAIPTFDLNETTSTFFTLGQNIYTPANISITTNQDDDRPWAGFLYGSVGITTLEENHVDELETTLGVVGPESLGEPIQKFIHKHISDSPTPQGWDNQLNFEPGLIVSAQRRWPRFYSAQMDTPIGKYQFQAEPNINASVGNIYTYAGTGLSFTFSPNYSIIQDKPPRVRPSMPGSGYFETPESGFGWVAFAGLEGRAIARNIFLDGNTFSDSHNVDKKYFVADASAGVALTYDRYRLSYSINARSKEFEGQDGQSVFGSMTLSTRF